MYYLLIDLLKCKKKKKRLWIIKQMVFKNWLLVLFTLKNMCLKQFKKKKKRLQCNGSELFNSFSHSTKQLWFPNLLVKGIVQLHLFLYQFSSKACQTTFLKIPHSIIRLKGLIRVLVILLFLFFPHPQKTSMESSDLSRPSRPA